MCQGSWFITSVDELKKREDWNDSFASQEWSQLNMETVRPGVSSSFPSTSLDVP